MPRLGADKMRQINKKPAAIDQKLLLSRDMWAA